jgi:hypothetical protein
MSKKDETPITIIRANHIGHIEALGRKYYFLQEFDGIIKPVGRKNQS